MNFYMFSFVDVKGIFTVNTSHILDLTGSINRQNAVDMKRYVLYCTSKKNQGVL